MAKDMRGGGLVRGKKGDKNPIRIRDDQAILPAKTVSAIKAAHGTEGLRAIIGMKKPAGGAKTVKAARGEAVLSAAAADRVDRTIPGGIRDMIARTAGRIPASELQAGGRYESGYYPDEDTALRGGVRGYAGVPMAKPQRVDSPGAPTSPGQETLDIRGPEFPLMGRPGDATDDVMAGHSSTLRTNPTYTTIRDAVQPGGMQAYNPWVDKPASAVASAAGGGSSPASSTPRQMYSPSSAETSDFGGNQQPGRFDMPATRTLDYARSRPFDVGAGRYLSPDQATSDVGILREVLTDPRDIANVPRGAGNVEYDPNRPYGTRMAIGRRQLPDGGYVPGLADERRAPLGPDAAPGTMVGYKNGQAIRYTIQGDGAQGGVPWEQTQNYKDAIARNARDKAELASIEDMKPGGAGYLRQKANEAIARTLETRGNSGGKYGGVGSTARLQAAQNAAAAFAGVDERAASTAATNRLGLARLNFDLGKEAFEQNEKNRRFARDTGNDAFKDWHDTEKLAIEARNAGRAADAETLERNGKWLDSVSGLEAAKASQDKGKMEEAQKTRDRMAFTMSQSLGRYGLDMRHIQPQDRAELEHLLPRVIENNKEAQSLFNAILAKLGAREQNRETYDINDVRATGRVPALYGADNVRLSGGGTLTQEQVVGGGGYLDPRLANRSRLRQMEREINMPKYLRDPDNSRLTYEEWMRQRRGNTP